jgi:hypothetical protein
LRTVGGTKKPPTDIHKPFANAVKARLTTKLGKMDDINTTRDSAATRSRNSHIIQMKKAVAVGRKFDSQYAMQEKSTVIKTGSLLAFDAASDAAGGEQTEVWQANNKIREHERCSAI